MYLQIPRASRYFRVLPFRRSVYHAGWAHPRSDRPGGPIPVASRRRLWATGHCGPLPGCRQYRSLIHGPCIEVPTMANPRSIGVRLMAAWRRPRLRPRRAWALEVLEGRAVPATLTVLNANDSGADSLRAAIDLANMDP